MSKSISVIGAGSIGVSSALHLQQRGWQVTLIDRREPGLETSYGNAGIINAGSLIPLNNPGIHKSLPTYLKNKSPQLRYNPKHILKNLPWAIQFLQNSKTSKANKASQALHELTSRSLLEHKAFMQRSGNMHRLSELGWLRLFREGKSYDPQSYEARQHKHYGIPGQVLSPDEIHDLEPSLNRIYASGYLLSGAASINNPGALVKEYAQQFVADGGTVLQTSIQNMAVNGDTIKCTTSSGTHECEKLLVAAGPWSNDVLAMLHYDVPLNVERGYHMHYQLPAATTLNRPLHDVQRGFIMCPMEMGVRVTSGVELNNRDAEHNYAQLEQIKPYISEAIALGEHTEDPIWKGNRPTLPDSKPIIGQAPKHNNVYFAFGHQHIGLMTGPITGKLIAELVSGERSDVDLSHFSPERYVRSTTRRKPVWEMLNNSK